MSFRHCSSGHLILLTKWTFYFQRSFSITFTLSNTIRRSCKVRKVLVNKDVSEQWNDGWRLAMYSMYFSLATGSWDFPYSSDLEVDWYLPMIFLQCNYLCWNLLNEKHFRNWMQSVNLSFGITTWDLLHGPVLAISFHGCMINTEILLTMFCKNINNIQGNILYQHGHVTLAVFRIR